MESRWPTLGRCSWWLQGKSGPRAGCATWPPSACLRRSSCVPFATSCVDDPTYEPRIAGVPRGVLRARACVALASAWVLLQGALRDAQRDGPRDALFGGARAVLPDAPPGAPRCAERVLFQAGPRVRALQGEQQAGAALAGLLRAGPLQGAVLQGA